eukprot:5758856-Pleurochrysis_carterae.AAC.3
MARCIFRQRCKAVNVRLQFSLASLYALLTKQFLWPVCSRVFSCRLSAELKDALANRDKALLELKEPMAKISQLSADLERKTKEAEDASGLLASQAWPALCRAFDVDLALCVHDQGQKPSDRLHLWLSLHLRTHSRARTHARTRAQPNTCASARMRSGARAHTHAQGA